MTEEDTRDEERLQVLVVRCLTALESGGGSAAVARICAENPTEAPRIMERLAGLGDLDLLHREARTMPDRIGPYRILDRLGEGGMGLVYRAEQREPMRRLVAIKVIKLGMDSKQVLRRFESERQALAMMEHGNIARVFDAGTTDRGQPYFVMEYVRGMPITEHCDQHRVSVEERIELFRQVCAGVQHAHQKGVMHRDLKPSNVLVTFQEGTAVPKIIDFGLARATDHLLTRATVFTERGVVLGTPEYMAPEQAGLGGQDVDSRADVYSLGVLLYELLVGELPFPSAELRRAGLAEMERMIKEQLPPKPSTRLSSQGAAPQQAARRRRTDPRSLLRRLRGDLDWVVMKALEKDRSRRYETPAALAEDLQRHLRFEPVLAGPPSAGYRIRKFARRYRGQVIAAGIVFATLIGGVIGTTHFMFEAQAARDAEAARAAELELVTEFQDAQLSAIEPGVMGAGLRRGVLAQARVAMERRQLGEAELVGRLRQLEELLAGANFTNLALESLEATVFQQALRAVDEQFVDQPLVMARLLQALASTMRKLGLVQAATEPQERALEIRRRELGNDDPRTLASIHNMANLLQAQGKLVAAERYASEALDGKRRALGDDHEDTIGSITTLGMVIQAQGRLDEAEPFVREAVDRGRKALGDDHEETLTAISNLGVLLWEQGKRDEAERFYLEALEGRKRVLGGAHANTLVSLNNMGFIRHRQGRVEEAEAYYREALDVKRALLGDEHPSTLTAINNMGSILTELGRYEEAEDLYREALSGQRRVLGDGHESTIKILANLAALNRDWGRLEDAEDYARQALDDARESLGADSAIALAASETLALVLMDRGQLEAADVRSREALEGRLARREDHPDTFRSMKVRGQVLEALGEFEAAEAQFRTAMAGRRRVHGENHPDTLTSLNDLGYFLMTRGRYDEAASFLRDAVEGRRRALGDDHPDTLTSVNNLGGFLMMTGQLEEAEPYLREAVEKSRSVLGDDHPDTVKSLNNLGYLHYNRGDYDAARPFFEEALQTSRREFGNDSPDTLMSINNMGFVLQAQGSVNEAEPYYREALQGYRRVFGAGHPDTLPPLNNLGSVLESRGKFPEAESCYRDGLEVSRAAHGADHPTTLVFINNIGVCFQRQGRLTEAEPYLREALEGRRRRLGDTHQLTLQTVHSIGTLLWGQDKPVEAVPYVREALLGRCQELGAAHPDTARSFNDTVALVSRLLEDGKLDVAETLGRGLLDASRTTFGERHPRTANAAVVMGRVLLATDAHEDAEIVLRECVSIREAALPADSWLIHNARSLLGASLVGQERYPEAEPLLRSGYEQMHPPERQAARKREALVRLVELYESWGRTEEAARWRKLLDG